MNNVIVYHHAQGLTEGVRAFARTLSAAGYTVTVPDLYDGKTFASISEGVAYAEQIGFETVMERGKAAAEALPSDLVYVGHSLGVMPAQMLTQTRPGTKGAVFLYSCLPTSAFDSPWPQGVPAQIHAMEGDEFFEEDRQAANDLTTTVPTVELFLYPGDQHLFADSSLPSYDREATELLMQRVIDFLGHIAG